MVLIVVHRVAQAQVRAQAQAQAQAQCQAPAKGTGINQGARFDMILFSEEMVEIEKNVFLISNSMRLL